MLSAWRKIVYVGNILWITIFELDNKTNRKYKKKGFTREWDIWNSRPLSSHLKPPSNITLIDEKTCAYLMYSNEFPLCTETSDDLTHTCRNWFAIMNWNIKNIVNKLKAVQHVVQNSRNGSNTDNNNTSILGKTANICIIAYTETVKKFKILEKELNSIKKTFKSCRRVDKKQFTGLTHANTIHE